MGFGQVPGKSTPLAMRTRIDPEVQRSLSEIPPPVTLDRMLDRPVLRAQDAVAQLGLSKALEHTLSLRIQKEATSAVNQLAFQKAINATMMESGLPPELQGIINARASRFFKMTLQKSGRREFFTLAEISELKKANKIIHPPAPGALPSPTPDQAKAEAERRKKAADESGISAPKNPGMEKAYPKLYLTGEKAREKKLQKKQLEGTELEKAFEPGGKYVARVKHEGKTKYYYDEEEYRKKHGEHVTGAQARDMHIHDSVKKTVECAGEAGCDVSHFRELVQKFGAKPVHHAVKKHVDEGAIQFKGGRFTAGKKAAGDKAKVKKSLVIRGQK